MSDDEAREAYIHDAFEDTEVTAYRHIATYCNAIELNKGKLRNLEQIKRFANPILEICSRELKKESKKLSIKESLKLACIYLRL